MKFEQKFLHCTKKKMEKNKFFFFFGEWKRIHSRMFSCDKFNPDLLLLLIYTLFFLEDTNLYLVLYKSGWF